MGRLLPLPDGSIRRPALKPRRLFFGVNVVKKITQGDKIARALKRTGHTYMEMLWLGYSVAPWRRVQEWLNKRPEWELRKGMRGSLVTWRVVKRKK